MENTSNRFSLSKDKTTKLLGELESCASASDFNLASDLCTISDIMWAIIHKQKDKNPELYAQLHANGIIQLSEKLSNDAYEFYIKELDGTANALVDVSVGSINASIKQCFKTLDDNGDVC